MREALKIYPDHHGIDENGMAKMFPLESKR